jgi:hypothetical protein
LANQTFNQTALNTTGIAGIWLLGNGQAGVAKDGFFSTGCSGAMIFSEQQNRLFNQLKYGDSFKFTAGSKQFASTAATALPRL